MKLFTDIEQIKTNKFIKLKYEQVKTILTYTAYNAYNKDSVFNINVEYGVFVEYGIRRSVFQLALMES